MSLSVANSAEQIFELSVVCPVYNECDHVDSLINFFLRAGPQRKELILVDGGSTDGTLDIIENYVQVNANIQVLHNPRKIVPYALNMAIGVAQAPIVVRLDAHTWYDDDYFENILATFKNTCADIVGGPTRTAFVTDTQEAVAYAICSPFAIGDSRVHNVEYEGYTDSVTFGAWKKCIFDKTGNFDTSLVRNQDDEFHYRARSFGYKIYQNPKIILYYYPRKTLDKLFSQYFQYGLYKPSVLKKIRSGMRLRHLIPSLFLIYLASLPFALLWPPILAPLILYLAVDLIASCGNEKRWKIRLRLLLIFPTIHISYGSGFLAGIWKTR